MAEIHAEPFVSPSAVRRRELLKQNGLKQKRKEIKALIDHGNYSKNPAVHPSTIVVPTRLERAGSDRSIGKAPSVLDRAKMFEGIQEKKHEIEISYYESSSDLYMERDSAYANEDETVSTLSESIPRHPVISSHHEVYHAPRAHHQRAIYDGSHATTEIVTEALAETSNEDTPSDASSTVELAKDCTEAALRKNISRNGAAVSSSSATTQQKRFECPPHISLNRTNSGGFVPKTNTTPQKLRVAPPYGEPTSARSGTSSCGTPSVADRIKMFEGAQSGPKQNQAEIRSPPLVETTSIPVIPRSPVNSNCEQQYHIQHHHNQNNNHPETTVPKPNIDIQPREISFNMVEADSKTRNEDDGVADETNPRARIHSVDHSTTVCTETEQCEDWPQNVSSPTETVELSPFTMAPPLARMPEMLESNPIPSPKLSPQNQTLSSPKAEEPTIEAPMDEMDDNKVGMSNEEDDNEVEIAQEENYTREEEDTLEASPERVLSPKADAAVIMDKSSGKHQNHPVLASHIIAPKVSDATEKPDWFDDVVDQWQKEKRNESSAFQPCKTNHNDDNLHDVPPSQESEVESREVESREMESREVESREMETLPQEREGAETERAIPEMAVVSDVSASNVSLENDDLQSDTNKTVNGLTPSENVPTNEAIVNDLKQDESLSSPSDERDETQIVPFENESANAAPSVSLEAENRTMDLQLATQESEASQIVTTDNRKGKAAFHPFQWESFDMNDPAVAAAVAMASATPTAEDYKMNPSNLHPLVDGKNSKPHPLLMTGGTNNDDIPPPRPPSMTSSSPLGQQTSADTENANKKKKWRQRFRWDSFDMSSDGDPTQQNSLEKEEEGKGGDKQSSSDTHDVHATVVEDTTDKKQLSMPKLQEEEEDLSEKREVSFISENEQLVGPSVPPPSDLVDAARLGYPVTKHRDKASVDNDNLQDKQFNYLGYPAPLGKNTHIAHDWNRYERCGTCSGYISSEDASEASMAAAGGHRTTSSSSVSTVEDVYDVASLPDANERPPLPDQPVDSGLSMEHLTAGSSVKSSLSSSTSGEPMHSCYGVSCGGGEPREAPTDGRESPAISMPDFTDDKTLDGTNVSFDYDDVAVTSPVMSEMAVATSFSMEELMCLPLTLQQQQQLQQMHRLQQLNSASSDGRLPCIPPSNTETPTSVGTSSSTGTTVVSKPHGMAATGVVAHLRAQEPHLQQQMLQQQRHQPHHPHQLPQLSQKRWRKTNRQRRQQQQQQQQKMVAFASNANNRGQYDDENNEHVEATTTLVSNTQKVAPSKKKKDILAKKMLKSFQKSTSGSNGGSSGNTSANGPNYHSNSGGSGYGSSGGSSGLLPNMASTSKLKHKILHSGKKLSSALTAELSSMQLKQEYQQVEAEAEAEFSGNEDPHPSPPHHCKSLETHHYPPQHNLMGSRSNEFRSRPVDDEKSV